MDTQLGGLLLNPTSGCREEILTINKWGFSYGKEAQFSLIYIDVCGKYDHFL